MSVTSVTIDGVDYIQSTGPGDWRIIVAERGWIFVGQCEDQEDGSVVIRNCYNIRRWGTSKGLGELVNGPLSKTQYDSYGVVTATPIFSIAVKGGWDALDE